MADTIITNTPDSNSSSGVVVAIIIAALAIGVFALYQNGVFQNAPEQVKSDTTEINVTVPDPITPAPAE